MIISRTPYRISFFGGATDFPAWDREKGGAVLATTIDKYCYLTCRYLPPFFEHSYRIVYSKIETGNHINQIQHPAVRAIFQHLNVARGMEVHHDGDLPAWSGVGSSSSFAVGLIHALTALQGRMCSKEFLAQEAIFVEQQLLRDVVGSQDQTLAAHGGFRCIEFHKSGLIEARPLTIPAPRVHDLKNHLLLFFTGQSRQSSQVAASYAHDIKSKARQLRLYQCLLKEALDLLNSDNSLLPFGDMLHEAWQAKRSLSDRVSTSLIDSIYDTAREHGATGGKILGAGGGGFLLLFAPPDRHAGIIGALPSLLHVPFDFEPHGSSIIYYNPEIDYASTEARRNSLRGAIASPTA